MDPLIHTIGSEKALPYLEAGQKGQKCGVCNVNFQESGVNCTYYDTVTLHFRFL